MIDDAPAQTTVFDYDVARAHATTAVPVVSATATADEIRAHLASRKFETVAEIVVCEEGRLLGLINIEDVLAARGDVLGRELMDADPPAVLPGVDQEVAVWKAIHKEETSLAVIDDRRQFLGMIPAARLVEILLTEHDEDMARLAGVLTSSGEARRASVEGVWQRLWHRFPWLILGLLGAFVAAEVVGSYEAQLQRNVLIALFIPGIVYLADAVGTQTETVVVRGLSVGVKIGTVARREILTGFLIGLLLAGICFPLALLRWGRTDVAGAVAVALAAACSTATVVAMVLPAILRRVGVDPAFGSGPLATVVQDILSIVIYFVVVTAFVN